MGENANDCNYWFYTNSIIKNRFHTTWGDKLCKCEKEKNKYCEDTLCLNQNRLMFCDFMCTFPMNECVCVVRVVSSFKPKNEMSHLFYSMHNLIIHNEFHLYHDRGESGKEKKINIFFPSPFSSSSFVSSCFNSVCGNYSMFLCWLIVWHSMVKRAADNALRWLTNEHAHTFFETHFILFSSREKQTTCAYY